MDNVHIGININCSHQDFIDQIISGEKTVETRNKNTLKSYVGKRVGLIETGKGKAMLRAYATITNIIRYDKESFRKDYNRHKVKEGSVYDIIAEKYGYLLTDVKAIDPIPVYSKGIISRKIMEG